MVTKNTIRLLNCEESKLFRQSDNCDTMDQNQMQPFSDDDDLSVRLCGKQMLNVTVEVLNEMKANHDIHVTWMADNKQRKQLSKTFCLDKDLVGVLVTKVTHIGETTLSSFCQIIGYTRAIITSNDQTKTILYAHPCVSGKSGTIGCTCISERVNRLVLRPTAIIRQKYLAFLQ